MNKLSDIQITDFFCSKCTCHFKKRTNFKDPFAERDDIGNIFGIKGLYVMPCLLHLFQIITGKLIYELAILNYANLTRLELNLKKLLKDESYSIKQEKQVKENKNRGEQQLILKVGMLTKSKIGILLKNQGFV
jgi:cadmium resistance protein CadD (predicted permease)